MTKKQEHFYRQYFYSVDESIFDVYKRPSLDKIFAETEILSRMENVKGRRYRVLSYNTRHFTAAYMYTDDKGKTWLHVETEKDIHEFIIE